MAVFIHEVYRLVKSRLYVAAILLTAVGSSLLALRLTSVPDFLEPSGIMAFGMIAGIFVFVAIFCGIFTGLFTADDLNKHVVDNALSVGVSKPRIYFAKLIGLMLVVFVVATISVITSIAIMTVIHGWNPGGMVYEQYTLKVLVFYGGMMVHYFAYASMFTMVAFITRSTAKTAGICAAFPFMEAILGQFVGAGGNNIAVFISSNLTGNLIQYAIIERIVAYDLILTGRFLLSVVPSIVIIVMTTAVGLLVFHVRD